MQKARLPAATPRSRRGRVSTTTKGLTHTAVHAAGHLRVPGPGAPTEAVSPVVCVELAPAVRGQDRRVQHELAALANRHEATAGLRSFA